MSSFLTSVEIRNVSKKFRLYKEKPSSLKARLISSRARAEDFAHVADNFQEPENDEPLFSF